MEVHSPSESEVQVVVTPGLPTDQAGMLVDLLEREGLHFAGHWQ